MGGSKGSGVQYIFYCTLPSAICRYCTGNKCNITGRQGFRLSFEPSFDAKIDKAKTCAINIVDLNTFTCGIEF